MAEPTKSAGEMQTFVHKAIQILCNHIGERGGGAEILKCSPHAGGCPYFLDCGKCFSRFTRGKVSSFNGLGNVIQQGKSV